MKLIFGAFIVSFYLIPQGISSQAFFNIQPDVGGHEMQGVCRVSIIDSTSIFIIGHRYDTTVSGDLEPWLGEFNYNGEIVWVSALIDSLYDRPFYPNKILLTQKEDDIYYVYVPRYLGGSYYTPYLIELNIRTGQIFKTILLPNSQYPNELTGLSAIHYFNDTINLLSYIYVNDSTKLFITQVDTSFLHINVIRVPQVLEVFYPAHLEIISNDSFEIIGDGFINHGNPEEYINNCLIRFDRKETYVDFKELPGNKRFSFNLSHTMTVKRNENSWVIAAHYIEHEENSCDDCFAVVPFVYSVDENFDNILWETRFYDVSFRFGISYELYSITALQDGYIVSGNFRNSEFDSIPSSGILIKVSFSGDSLWMKHFVPLNWEDSRVAWAKLRNVKTTPYGSIVAVGEIADKELQIIRPWILHVDEEGCLIPGCNTVSVDETSLKQNPTVQFMIYPNPAQDELYIISKSNLSLPSRIKIVSIDGSVVKFSKFHAIKDHQYILPINELPTGLYSIIFEDEFNKSIETHRFFHN